MASRRGNSWQARVKGPDKYHRYSFPSQAQAEDWEREARKALKDGRAITPPALSAPQRLHLRDLYDKFSVDIWGRRQQGQARSGGCLALPSRLPCG